MPKQSAFAQRLNDRMKAKRRATAQSAAPIGSSPSAAPSAPQGFPPEAGYVHPNRYPKHTDPLKGQVLGGECNRTACHSRRAVFYNIGTKGLYCVTCARGINGHDPVPLCVMVDEKPGPKRMAEMEQDMYARMRAHRDTHSAAG